MIYRDPCSHINNKSVIFGLSYSDITSLGGVLAIVLFINKHLIGVLNVSYWALSSVLMGAFLLIPIRLQFRRKIIRDFIKYFFRRRIIYAPKHHRLHSGR